MGLKKEWSWILPVSRICRTEVSLLLAYFNVICVLPNRWAFPAGAAWHIRLHHIRLHQNGNAPARPQQTFCGSWQNLTITFFKRCRFYTFPRPILGFINAEVRNAREIWKIRKWCWENTGMHLYGCGTHAAPKRDSTKGGDWSDVTTLDTDSNAMRERFRGSACASDFCKERLISSYFAGLFHLYLSSIPDFFAFAGLLHNSFLLIFSA